MDPNGFRDFSGGGNLAVSVDRRAFPVSCHLPVQRSAPGHVKLAKGRGFRNKRD
jgi:hypothetical protein